MTEETFCKGCKKTLEEEKFMMNGKKYAKCLSCRLKLKNYCKVCGICACFNMEGEKNGLYCNEHKLAGMVDVKHKRCIYEGCKIRPNFNVEGETEGLYCNTHKQVGMIDVKHKRCIYEGCKTRPSFNFEGETEGLYCDTHKLTGMIDVKHTRCKFTEKNCRTRATFNFPNMYPDFCSKHKKDGMISEPRKKCIEDQCYSIAIYGILIHIHCEEHKQEGEYNLVERKCLNPACDNKFIDILDINGFCVSFCSMIEQSKLYKKYQKKKEMAIKNLLEKHIDIPLYMYDEKGDNGCSTSKPDFVYHLGTHILIIEVDEKQHKSYKNCGETKEKSEAIEKRRMYNLSSEFDGLPLIFIRYNPDNYRVNEKLMKTTDKQRHDLLIRWVKKCISYKTFFGYGILVKYLFFDEHNETDISFIRITEDDFNSEDFI